MTRGRQRAAWQRTAEVLCLMANIHRNPKERRKPFTADQFMPEQFRTGSRRKGVPVTHITDLKIFVPPKKEPRS